MAVDLSVFERLKTKQDFDREAEQFALKQLASSGQSPAAVQLANELQKARASGDTQRLNDLYMAAKLGDRGIGIGPDGQYMELGGYGQAVGGIAAQKAGMEQQAEKNVDLMMNPQIEMGVSNARNQSDLQYALPTSQAEKYGSILGEQQGATAKKVGQAMDNISTAEELLAKDASGRDLFDKATGSNIGAAVAVGKQFFGKSDESTQANAALEVLAGRFLNNVPRMEGPQSNADLASYQAQAGKLGNPTIPAPDRRAALAEIVRLSKKYAQQNQMAIPGLDLPAFGIGTDLPDYQDRVFDAQNPVYPPEQTVAPQFKEGQIAKNPQTGERMMFTKGQWKPL